MPGTPRIIEHPDRGFVVAQHVPDPVAHAFDNLVEHGYTRRLLT